MKAAPVAKPPAKFDLAKLESMTEPFNVRVEKIRGSMRYEIPLPPSDNGGTPGTGWSKDQVREMQTWLVNEWSGGGHYFISIVDSMSQMMEWTSFYPPGEFPEKTPPTLQGATAFFIPPPAAPAAVQQQNQVRQMAQFPGGNSLPLASYFQQPGAPVAQPSNFYPPTAPYQPMVYSQPSSNNEAAMLREALAQAREQAAQREFERRLAEMKADSERKFVELQQMMQALVQQMTQAMQAQAKPAIDPMVEQMREQNRQLQEQVRAQRDESERVRREAELREEMRRTQETTAKLVEEANRRFEAFMATNANKGPDSQVLMFQTMFQSQMEAMKEIARNSQNQLDRVQHFMMRPQDVMSLAKESSSSTDEVVRNISRQYEQMFGLSRQLIEQAAQLNQGGGNEVVGLIRDAGNKLGEWAERYTGGKSKEAVAQMNAQAEIARAQADVIKSQQERMADMARIEAALKTGAAVQMPDGTFRAGGAPQAAIPAPGTNGHGPTTVVPPTPPWVPPRTPRVETKPAPAAPAAPPATSSSGLGGAPIEQGAQVIPIIKQTMSATGEMQSRRIHGRTDLEWFGPALGNVVELRNAVEQFLDGLRQTPPVKQGASPDMTALIIQQAAYEAMQKQIPIAAMIELLMQGMVAEFLDVLLPEAPQTYRDDVAQILMSGQASEDADDDEDDEDEDEDESQPAPAS